MHIDRILCAYSQTFPLPDRVMLDSVMAAKNMAVNINDVPGNTRLVRKKFRQIFRTDEILALFFSAALSPNSLACSGSEILCWLSKPVLCRIFPFCLCYFVVTPLITKEKEYLAGNSFDTGNPRGQFLEVCPLCSRVS